VLIATYALTHGVPVPAADRDFQVMRRAGSGLIPFEA
jgi:hypothetical protein